jgi:tRNA uridine 5-carbamoylmethylation protein Kti12
MTGLIVFAGLPGTGKSTPARVSPWMLTRNAWRNVGLQAGARVVEIETLRTDLVEHRRRVETGNERSARSHTFRIGRPRSAVTTIHAIAIT